MPTLENTAPVSEAPAAVAAPVEAGKPAKAAKKAAPKKAAAKKEAPKKAAKAATKAPAKKEAKAVAAPKKAEKPAKAAPKAAKEAGERGPSKTQTEVLKVLANSKSGELTRSQLSEALDNAWVGSDMMGHLDSAQAKATSLTARGLVKASTYPNKETGAEGPVHYALTAAGKKFVEALGK